MVKNPLLPRLALGACSCAGLALAVIMAGCLARDPVPTTLPEVRRRADSLGLHVLDLGEFGTGRGCLLIGEDPLSAEIAAHINMARPHAPYWIGRVYVYDPGASGVHVVQPRSAAAWGRLYVLGDRELIDRLSEP